MARVEGSGFNFYDVVLTAGKPYSDYQCSCPMGEDGECCKHVVATVLAWIEQNGKTKVNRKSKARQDDAVSIRDYLLAQPKESLAEWLLTQCAYDADLRDALSRKAARRRKTPRRKPRKRPPARRAKATCAIK